MSSIERPKITVIYPDRDPAPNDDPNPNEKRWTPFDKKRLWRKVDRSLKELTREQLMGPRKPDPDNTPDPSA